MTQIHQDEIDEIVEEMNGAGVEGREWLLTEYSGRAMYGATCVGVVGLNEALAFYALLDQRGYFTGPASMDSAGQDVLIYWNQLEAKGDE